MSGSPGFTLLLTFIAWGLFMGICAYSTLLERKVCAWIQGRLGPNRAVPSHIGNIPWLGRTLQRLGLFHPLADGLKSLFKEDPVPVSADRWLFCLAPVLALSIPLLLVTLVPIGFVYDTTGTPHPFQLLPFPFAILLFFGLEALSPHSAVLGAWASRNDYSLMGTVRAATQVMSSRLIFLLSLMPLCLWYGDATLAWDTYVKTPLWAVFTQPLSALLCLLSLFIENQKLPFDMTDSEANLIGGFHTEYGGLKLRLFFTAAHAHLILGCAVFACLFLGGPQLLPFLKFHVAPGLITTLFQNAIYYLKIAALLFVFTWVRWTLPRFRYGQVLPFTWDTLLPLALINLFANITLYLVTH